MYFISLGGVGGCTLAEALRRLNQKTHPYDWLISSQSFVMTSFFDKSCFFDESSSFVHNKTNLIMANKSAIMLHDFIDYDHERRAVQEKYHRRFDRLYEMLLSSNVDILFIRIIDNLSVNLVPLNYYNDIYNREEENFEEWDQFMDDLNKKFHSHHNLLLLSTNEAHASMTGKKYLDIVYIRDKSSETIHDTILLFKEKKFGKK
jgi:hypothetical protein